MKSGPVDHGWIGASSAALASIIKHDVAIRAACRAKATPTSLTRDNAAVDSTPLSLDTSPEIEQRQIEAWRRMSDAEKLALAMSMSRTVRELALAGVRQRHPDASAREQFLRLAIVTLGEELARKAYPEIDQLDRT